MWNRTRAKAEAIADQGCGVADTIADLRDSDVVFTMVSTPADLEQVLLGEGGLLVDPSHLPGAVVDCSTVSIESSERDPRGVRRRRRRLPGRAGERQRQGRRFRPADLVVSGPSERTTRSRSCSATSASR